MIPLAGQKLNTGHLMQPTANATGQSVMISLPDKSAAGRHAFAEPANTKGATRVTPSGLLLHSGQDNPQTSGLQVVAARPHQAHPNNMARATANVLSNNRIVIL
jgi:hypothetical protein